MRKFVLLFICSIFIQASWALKCKMCKDSSCKTLEDQTCPASPSHQTAACLTHIYKVNKDSKEEITEKKCVNRFKDGKYDCVKANSQEVEIKCETCIEDMCNEKSSAPKIYFSLLSVVGVVLLTKIVL